jgi:uncharacterized protein DUF4279
MKDTGDQSMHRYTVSLRITGEALEPGEVTRNLVMEPTQTRKKGERRSATSAWSESMWALEVRPPAKDEWDSLAEGLTSLLAIVAPLRGQIHSYRPANKVCLWCGHFTSSFDGGPVLSPEVMQALAEFGVELVIDTYCKSPMGDD